MKGRDAAWAVLRAALRRDMTGWMPNMCESGGCTYVFDMELDDGYTLSANVDVYDPAEPVGFSVSIENGFDTPAAISRQAIAITATASGSS